MNIDRDEVLSALNRAHSHTARWRQISAKLASR